MNVPRKPSQTGNGANGMSKLSNVPKEFKAFDTREHVQCWMVTTKDLIEAVTIGLLHDDILL